MGGGWGAGRGKQDYCGATGRPQVTFKIIRGAPCCLPTVPTPVHDYNMHRRGDNICILSVSEKLPLLKFRYFENCKRHPDSYFTFRVSDQLQICLEQ